MPDKGKYDDLAEYCFEKAKAEAVVVIVFEGKLGSGVSISEANPVWDAVINSRVKPVLPGVLRFFGGSNRSFGSGCGDFVSREGLILCQSHAASMMTFAQW